MAISVRAVSRTSAYPAPSTVSVAAQAGDLLVVVAGYDTGGTVALATPATSLGPMTRQSPTVGPSLFSSTPVGVFTQVATAAGTYSTTVGNNGNNTGVHTHMYALVGVDTTNPVVGSANRNASSRSQIAETVTGTAGGLLLCGFQDAFVSSTPATKTGPAGMAYGNGPDAGGPILGSGTEALTVDGATGTRTATSSVLGRFSTVAITFRAGDTAPAAPPNGTAVGEFTFAGAATGSTPAVAPVAKTGSASGIWAWVGTAAGRRTPRGTGVGTWTFAGTSTGARTPRAVAAGTWAWLGASTGKRVPRSTASGLLAYVGTGAGRRQADATASGLLAWAGNSAGTRTTRGSAAGSWTFTGAATGIRKPQGVAVAGTVTTVGTATGTAPIVGGKSGAAVGNWTWSGAATGRRAPTATAAGTLSYTATGTGRRTPKATSTGLFTYVGTAAGTKPVVGAKTGTATGTYIYVGAATGRRQPAATASSTWTLTGTADGTRASRGVASGALTWTGLGTGSIRRTATAAGQVTWLGRATGQPSSDKRDITITWGPLATRALTAGPLTTRTLAGELTSRTLAGTIKE